MFDWARSAGLPMLGGYDVYVYHRDASVRAHFWPAGQASRNPDEKYVVNATAPAPSNAHKTIVILPGFTEFCEKYSAEVLHFHEKGYHVLIIDWPGQGQSGHFGRHPLAVHCTDFDHHLSALDLVISAVGLVNVAITVMAIAAVGMKIDLSELRHIGMSAFFLIIAETIFVAVFVTSILFV